MSKMAVPITSMSQALLDLHSIGMGLYPSLCLVNASCDQVRQILKKTLSKKISVSVLMKILVSSLSAFKDTDIVL